MKRQDKFDALPCTAGSAVITKKIFLTNLFQLCLGKRTVSIALATSFVLFISLVAVLPGSALAGSDIPQPVESEAPEAAADSEATQPEDGMTTEPATDSESAQSPDSEESESTIDSEKVQSADGEASEVSDGEVVELTESAETATPEMSPALSLDTRSVKVVYREQIESSGAADLFGFLGYQPGFNTFGMYRPLVLTTNTTVYMINGNRIPSPFGSWVLEFLPISAVEKIEFISSGATSLYSSGAISGATNIVLRKNIEGKEAWAKIQNAMEEGGDILVGGSLWGGKVGQGHLTIGAEFFDRSQIRGKDRDYSRGRWTEGGEFAGTTGVSAGGNTIFFNVPDPDNPDDRNKDMQVAYPLGDCNPARGYTGVLQNPFGIQGSSGCGFVYADQEWAATSFERESFFTSYEHPLSETSQFYFDGRISQGESENQWAPTAGFASFDPSDELLAQIQQDIPEIAQKTGSILSFHRFVSLENRSWIWDLSERDLVLGLRGDLMSSNRQFDLSVRSYRTENRNTGRNFVHRGRFAQAVEDERYNLLNPFSTDADHIAALEEINVSLIQDLLIARDTVRALFSGVSNSETFGQVDWNSGVEIDVFEHSDIFEFRGSDGTTFAADETLGSGVQRSFMGSRKRLSGFVDLRLPLRPTWELSTAARFDRHNDVDSTFSWHLGSAWQLNDSWQVRGSLDAGRMPPSMSQLYLEDLVDQTDVCDTKYHTDPTVTCREIEVDVVDGGNPLLEPDRSNAINLGATAELGKVTLDLDYYRIQRKDVPTVGPSAQKLVDLDAAGMDLPAGAEIIRQGDDIVRIMRPTVNDGERVQSGINVGLKSQWKTDSVTTDLGVYWLYTDRYKWKVGGEYQSLSIPRNRMHVYLNANWGDVTATWNTYGIDDRGNFKRLVMHDVMFNWQKDVANVESLELNAGLLNVTDEWPSTDVTDPAIAENHFPAIRGRTAMLSVRLMW